MRSWTTQHVRTSPLPLTAPPPRLLWLTLSACLLWCVPRDPADANWFVPYHAYPHGGWQRNHSCKVPTPSGPCASDEYTTQPCTYERCSGLWHDQTQVPRWPGPHSEQQRLGGGSDDGKPPQYDNGVCSAECDCGKLPCGNYIYNHLNDSMSEWFTSVGGAPCTTDLHGPPCLRCLLCRAVQCIALQSTHATYLSIIMVMTRCDVNGWLAAAAAAAAAAGPIINNNQTLLQPGVVSFYIDDSFWHNPHQQKGDSKYSV